MFKAFLGPKTILCKASGLFRASGYRIPNINHKKKLLRSLYMGKTQHRSRPYPVSALVSSHASVGDSGGQFLTFWP